MDQEWLRLRDKLEMAGYDVNPTQSAADLKMLYDVLTSEEDPYEGAFDDPDEVVEVETEAEDHSQDFSTTIEESECFGVSWQIDMGVCGITRCEARKACERAWEQSVADKSLVYVGASDPASKPHDHKMDLVSEPVDTGLVFADMFEDDIRPTKWKDVNLIPMDFVPESADEAIRHRENKYSGRMPLAKDEVKRVYAFLAETLEPGYMVKGLAVLEFLRYMEPEKELWRRKDILRNLHRSLRLISKGKIGVRQGFYYMREYQL